MKMTFMASVLIILTGALPALAGGEDLAGKLHMAMVSDGMHLSMGGSPAAGNDHLSTGDMSSQAAGIPLSSEGLLFVQHDGEDLSHQTLASTMQQNGLFYLLSVSGSLPALDETFRDFLDYGGSVSFGAGKKVNDKLSIIATLGVAVMTGDWSIKGDRESIEVAAETYFPGISSSPGSDTVITPEELGKDNLGIGYHSEGEAIITSSESLENIDVHTDLYLFPLSVNALYHLKQVGGFNAYAGGGLGFCLAVRDCNSRAVKEKYFIGPEYKVSLNDSQSVTGLMVNLLAGVNFPIYENLKFVAEAGATLYDLKSFDPILEISPISQNPAWYPYSDLTTYSYEKPLRIGVFKEVYVANLSAGLVMPF